MGRSGVGLWLSACVCVLFHFDSQCGFQVGQGKGKRFFEVGSSSRLAGMNTMEVLVKELQNLKRNQKIIELKSTITGILKFTRSQTKI